jgi:hypothetical protein
MQNRLIELDAYLDDVLEFTTFKYVAPDVSNKEPTRDAGGLNEPQKTPAKAKDQKKKPAKTTAAAAPKKTPWGKYGKYGAIGAGAVGLGYGAHHLYRQHKQNSQNRQRRAY